MILAPPHSADEARPRGLGYGARINGAWYRLAVGPETPLQLLVQDELAERTQQGVNSFENLLKTGYAFIRGNFTGGEGLDRYPRTPPGPLDDTRYWASNNVDLRRPKAGKPYSISLANRYDTWFTLPDPITEVRATVERLYAARGTGIATWLTDADPSPDVLFTFPAAVKSFDMTDAEEGVALLTDGTVWYKPVESDTWTKITDPVLHHVLGVWILKGRVIIWRDDVATASRGELVEVGLVSTGPPNNPSFALAETVIDTFHAEVLGLVDAGMCILAMTTDRTIRSYSFQQGAVDEPPVLALQSTSPMPKGEQPFAIAHNSSILFILSAWQGTVRGYAAEMLDEKFNFIVGNLTLVREWTDVVVSTDPMIRQVGTARDSFLWLIPTAAGPTDLWRYDLVTTGIHRHARVSETLRDGVTWWRDRVYVFTRGQPQLARTSPLFQAEGWLITPLVNFNLNADINWTELTIQAYDLGIAGPQVEVSISAVDEALLDHRHPSWRIVAQLTSPTIDVLEVPLVNEAWPKLAMRLVLRPHSNGAGTPHVTQVGLRGIPAATETTVELPISVSDQVEAPGRMPVRIAGHGNMLLDSLMALRGTAVDVEVVAPPMRVRGVVRSVSSMISYLSHRGSVGHYAMVQILGEPLPSGSAQLGLGGQGIGIGLLGVATLGIGDDT